MLIKQFKQRYRKKNNRKLKLSLITMSLLVIILSVLFSTYKQAIPSLHLPITTNYLKPFRRALAPKKPIYTIIKESANSPAKINRLYLTTSCTKKSDNLDKLTPTLKKANIKYAKEIKTVNNKECQRLVIGPINNYQELNRAQYVLHKLEQKKTIMTRR